MAAEQTSAAAAEVLDLESVAVGEETVSGGTIGADVKFGLAHVTRTLSSPASPDEETGAIPVTITAAWDEETGLGVEGLEDLIVVLHYTVA